MTTEKPKQQLTKTTDIGKTKLNDTRTWFRSHFTPSSQDMFHAYSTKGDHSPVNVKFPDDSQHTSAALGMLSVTHIMPVLVLNTCTDENMQLTINSFR